MELVGAHAGHLSGLAHFDQGLPFLPGQALHVFKTGAKAGFGVPMGFADQFRLVAGARHQAAQELFPRPRSRRWWAAYSGMPYRWDWIPVMMVVRAGMHTGQSE